MARHGTRTSYSAGCRCDPCKLAESNYQKKRRHGTDDATITTLPSSSKDPVDNPEPKLPGVCEQAAIDTLADTPSAIERPDLYQAALAMARIMDNPVTVAQWVQAAGRYDELSGKLMQGTERRHSRLAAVQDMIHPKTATG